MPTVLSYQVRAVAPDAMVFEEVFASHRVLTGTPHAKAVGYQLMVYWPGTGEAMMVFSRAIFEKRHHHWRYLHSDRSSLTEVRLEGQDSFAKIGESLSEREVKAMYRMIAILVRSAGGAKALSKPLPTKLTDHPPREERCGC